MISDLPSPPMVHRPRLDDPKRLLDFVTLEASSVTTVFFDGPPWRDRVLAYELLKFSLLSADFGREDWLSELLDSSVLDNSL